MIKLDKINDNYWIEYDEDRLNHVSVEDKINNKKYYFDVPVDIIRKAINYNCLDLFIK